MPSREMRAAAWRRRCRRRVSVDGQDEAEQDGDPELTPAR
jgi:hypothetical protein